MKRFYLLLVLSIALNLGLAYAEDAPTPAQDAAMAPEMQEMMAKFQEFSTPNENHKVLNGLTGSWDYEMKWWMEPGGQPEVSTGEATGAWVMDGHFVELNVMGASATSMGMIFNGKSTMGYDNLKKKYVSTWIDNMSTGIMSGTGSYDTATNALTDEGTFSCPMVDGDRSYRGVTKFVDGDHYTYEMYMQDPKSGQEFMNMQINYTRKK